MVYLLLGEGFEEIEAITIADILRRAQIPMQTVGIGGKAVTGAHGLPSLADIAVEDLDLAGMTAVILPGGLGGVESIEASAPAMAAVEYAMKHDRYVGAICAAPTILGKRGWLDGKQATCYPGMESGMGKALKDVDIPDDAFKSVEAIILSMTPYEREHPEIINGSRRKRIADGSGTSVPDVNRLLKQFEGTRKVMKGAVTGSLMQQLRGRR